MWNGAAVSSARAVLHVGVADSDTDKGGDSGDRVAVPPTAGNVGAGATPSGGGNITPTGAMLPLRDMTAQDDVVRYLRYSEAGDDAGPRQRGNRAECEPVPALQDCLRSLAGNQKAPPHALSEEPPAVVTVATCVPASELKPAGMDEAPSQAPLRPARLHTLSFVGSDATLRPPSPSIARLRPRGTSLQHRSSVVAGFGPPREVSPSASARASPASLDWCVLWRVGTGSSFTCVVSGRVACILCACAAAQF